MKTGVLIARLLRQLAEEIESMDDVELASLTAYRSYRTGPLAKRIPTKKQEKIDPAKIEDILRQLEGAGSRHVGMDILNGHELSRSELTRLARLRNVHVTKEDNISRIKEKLIESLIGARLGSLAIRGGQ